MLVALQSPGATTTAVQFAAVPYRTLSGEGWAAILAELDRATGAYYVRTRTAGNVEQSRNHWYCASSHDK